MSHQCSCGRDLNNNYVSYTNAYANANSSIDRESSSTISASAAHLGVGSKAATSAMSGMCGKTSSGAQTQLTAKVMHWPEYLLHCFLLIHITSHYVGSTDETYAETEAASNGEVSTLELPRPLIGYRKQRVQETFTLELMPPGEQLEDEVAEFVDLKNDTRSTRSRRRTMMDIALEASAREGLHAMTEFYGRIEPEIIRNGQLLAENHPAALLSKFSAPVDETGDSEMAAYAAITATKAFKKNYKHLNELARQAHTPKISLRRTALEGLCPPRDAPTCMPASARYRTHDGTCNNKRRLRWGAAHMPFNRFLPPDYGDGVDTIRNSVDNVPLSSSRFVSLLVHGAKDGDAPLTLMTAQWGQLLDHDMTSTAQPRSINGSVPSCCGGKDFHPSCFPIKVPLDDPWLAPLKVRCLEFLRSAPAQRRDCVLSWREQTNQATSYIDASPIYSSSTKSSDNARVFRNGLLVFGRGNPEQDVCQRGAIATQCIRSGDGRSGEQPGLLALHHVWVGEHNRIAMELSELNLHWSDEKLYQETRRIIGAMFQHITYREFLPIILGREVCKLFELELQTVGYYEGYDAKTNPTVANSFAAAAFRFGHSLIQNTYMRCDRHHNSINNNVSLHEEFQRGDIGSAGSLHRLLRGLATQRALRRDEFITPELTNHLFQTPGFPFGLDLAAINIQRGRDHGIAPYTAWRVPCGLTPINTWDDFANIVGPESAKRIGHAYRSVHDIDLFVGGISERPVVGGLVGPTFACIIAQQFSNSRKGDRFWYENSGFESSFTPAQLHSIRRVSLAQVLCRAVGGGTFQPHIFIPHTFTNNQRLPCGVGPLTPIDLAPWLEQDPFAAPLLHPTFDANIPDKVFDIIPNDMNTNQVPSAHLMKEDKTSINNHINLAHTPLLQTPLSPTMFQRQQNVSKINDKLDFKRKGTTKRPTQKPITGVNNKLDKGPKINLSVNRHRRPQTTTRRTVVINNIPLELRTEPNVEPTTSKKNATKTSSSAKKKNTIKTVNHLKARINLNKEDSLQLRNTTDDSKEQTPEEDTFDIFSTLEETPTKTLDEKQERKTIGHQTTNKYTGYFKVLNNTTAETENSGTPTIVPSTEKTSGLKPTNMTTGRVTFTTPTKDLFETRQTEHDQLIRNETDKTQALKLANMTTGRLTLTTQTKDLIESKLTEHVKLIRNETTHSKLTDSTLTANMHNKTTQMLNRDLTRIQNKKQEFVKNYESSTITDRQNEHTYTSSKTRPQSLTENDAYRKSHMPFKKFSTNDTYRENSAKPSNNPTNLNDSRGSYTGLKTTPRSLFTLAKLTSSTVDKKPQMEIRNLTVTNTKNTDLIILSQNPKLTADPRRRYTGLKTTTESTLTHTQLTIGTSTNTAANKNVQTSLLDLTASSSLNTTLFTTSMRRHLTPNTSHNTTLFTTSMRRHLTPNMNQNKQVTQDTDIDPLTHSTSKNHRRVQRNFDLPHTNKKLGSERNTKFLNSNTTNHPFKLVTAFNLHVQKNRTLKHTTKLPKTTKIAKTTPESAEIRQYQTRPIYTRPQKVIVDGPHAEQYEIEINIRQTNKSPVMRPTSSYADYTTSYRPHTYDRYTNFADYTSTTPAYAYYTQVPTTAANLVQLQRTRPPTVIYLDEHDERTTKAPSLLQNFLTFATSGFGANRNPVNQKEKPIFSQNNAANMGLAGTLASSPHSSLASSQYPPEPPQPMASSFNHIGGYPNNGAQAPHVASGAVSGGNFGSITGVASTNGADSTFSFNIRPRPPAVNPVNVGSANPTGASYGQYGLIPTRRPTYAQASRPDFNNLPIAAYAVEQYNKLPNRESLSPFSTGHKAPQQQSYFRTQNVPQLKDPKVNRNDVPNLTNHKIDISDYDYLSRTLETITENDNGENKHIDESVDYEYDDDLESDEPSKKFDRDGYIRPEHMIASLLKNPATATSNTTNDNKTATLDDNFVLPVLNSSKRIFTDIPVPIKSQKEMTNRTNTTTGLTDALAKHLHNDILAEDYDEDTSDAFVVSKTAALTAMTGNKPKNLLQKASFAPINILTKPERPDNWVIYDTPEEKPLLPELPEINVETYSAAEVPMPFADLTNVWLTKYRNKLVRERDYKNNLTVQHENIPMTQTHKYHTVNSTEIHLTDVDKNKNNTMTDSTNRTLSTIMTEDSQTDGSSTSRNFLHATTVNGTMESVTELKVMPEIRKNVTNIPLS